MIDHLAFIVEDPESTAELLGKFGYLVTRRTPHHAGSIEVENPQQPGLIIELCSQCPQEATGFDHICLRLAGQETYNALEQGGMIFTNKPYLCKESGRYITNHIDSDGIRWQVTF